MKSNEIAILTKLRNDDGSSQLSWGIITLARMSDEQYWMILLNLLLLTNQKF